MHQIKSTLGKALRYIVRPDATQGGLLVSTTAAVIDPSDWNATAESFEAARELRQGSGRKSSVLAHHVIQAFAPGEITSGAQAHDLGVAFAERITQGRFAYTLATHLDKGHLHNHLIINAVSHVDGKALRVQKQTLGDYRAISDELCRGMGLSVIERTIERDETRTDTVVRPRLAEVYTRARGASRHEQVRLAIDHAVSASSNWLDYELTLEAQGIEVGRSQKRAVTYRTESMARAVRDVRLGPAYSEGAVMARLGKTSVLRFDAHESLVVPVRTSTRASSRASSRVPVQSHGEVHREAQGTAPVHDAAGASMQRAVTIKVPGTAGQRCIAVHPDQVVQHGKTLRIYLPEHGTQAILNRSGGIVANVPTKALYAAFTPPARELAGRLHQIESSRGLRGGKRVREQVERLATSANLLNVRGRFGILTETDALAHVAALGAEIERAETRIQHLAVALDESAPGSQERADLRVQLTDASRSMGDLQTTATELIQWAKTAPPRESGHPGTGRTELADLADVALRERLGDVDPADLSAIGVPAERVSQLLDQPASGGVSERPEQGPAGGPANASADRADVSAKAPADLLADAPERAREALGRSDHGDLAGDGTLPPQTAEGRNGQHAQPLEDAVEVSWEDVVETSDSLVHPAGPGDGASDPGGLDVEEERAERSTERRSASRSGPGRDVSQRPAGWKTMSLTERAAWLSGRSVRESARDTDDNTPKRRR